LIYFLGTPGRGYRGVYEHMVMNSGWV
jgi:hypothetical protein